MPIKNAKEPMPSPMPGSSISPELIREQLHRILAHPEFHGTPQQKQFLRFVVLETLEGRQGTIKGYTVATQVFGRQVDFDPKIDPIVSIQANKLRRALERYYLVAGGDDPVRIDLPKGTYVPIFQFQGEHGSEAVSSRDAPTFERRASWPTVLVKPFRNLTGDPDKDYLGVGLATELAVEVARYQEIRALVYEPGGRERSASDSVARFIIDGNVREDKTGIMVAVHLTDTTTNKRMWGDTHRFDFEAAQTLAFQEEVAHLVAVKATGGHGVIAKTLSMESKSIPPADLKTYEAILRFYDYNRLPSPDNFSRAFQALDHATSKEPECGLAWSILGRLYAEIYAFEYPGFEIPLEKALERAIECTEKGVQLNPDNQRSRVLLGYVRMICDEVPAAKVEVEEALALNPRSLLMLDVIGYLLTLLGEWERGPAILRKVIRRNPFYSHYVNYALWLDWIRQEEYEQAHLETLNMRTPLTFWVPFFKAATLGRLGRYEEGKREVENLLKLKPDFSSRGRVIMKHYIKFEELVERIIEGLNKVGLSVE